MANTPWGELTVSDSHVHYFSHAFYSTLAAQKGLDDAKALQPMLNWELPLEHSEGLAGQWVRELDKHRVSRAALIASVPGDERSVANAMAAHPLRFFGYFMFNPLQTGATERLAAAAANPNLHTVCLFPAMHGYSVAEDRLRETFEIAAAGRLTIFVHCGALSVGVRRKLGLPSPYDMRFSNPVDLHPVALRHPHTNFVVPHFGAGMFREALMLADLCPNVYFDTSSSNRWMIYEGLTLVNVFRRALSVAGARRLLFGTDSSFFPRGWNSTVFDTQVNALADIGINAEDAARIFGGNLDALHRSRNHYFAAGTQA